MPQKQMHKNAAKRLGATTDVVSITYGVHHSEITPTLISSEKARNINKRITCDFLSINHSKSA